MGCCWLWMLDEVSDEPFLPQDSKVHILSLSGSELSEERTVDVSAEVSVVAYSPDGQYLAAAHHRTVTVHNATDGKVKPSQRH